LIPFPYLTISVTPKIHAPELWIPETLRYEIHIKTLLTSHSGLITAQKIHEKIIDRPGNP
jgi:hypothetical protein